MPKLTDEQIERLFSYHQPNDYDQIRRIAHVRNEAIELALAINECVPESADKSAAIRLLRECVMTANAGIVLNPAE